jgi:hypothetical protein
LGFQLRSKDIARPLFATLGNLASQNPQAAAVFSMVVQALGDPVKVALERAILAVAWRHGFWTWIGAKKQLRSKVDLPADLKTKSFSPAMAANAAGIPQTAPGASVLRPKSGVVNSQPGQ